jgi:hypothetical protein
LYETDLYAPVKSLFEALGFTVKAEIAAADIVARRGDDPPVIIELKLSFTLALLHQAIARQAMSDAVYVAVPKWKGRAGWKTFKGNISLCRRLGLGLISVDLAGHNARIHCDPAPYHPRKSKVKLDRLKAEFDRRQGDPNTGGSTRRKIMTAYRQAAIRCAKVLKIHGPSRGADVAKLADVSIATRLMADNHYGWFVRVARGVYDLTSEGAAMLDDPDQN